MVVVVAAAVVVVGVVAVVVIVSIGVHDAPGPRIEDGAEPTHTRARTQ